jgi:hypothetical protein
MQNTQAHAQTQTCMMQQHLHMQNTQADTQTQTQTNMHSIPKKSIVEMKPQDKHAYVNKITKANLISITATSNPTNKAKNEKQKKKRTATENKQP